MSDTGGLFEIHEIRSTRVFGIVCFAHRRDDPLKRRVALKVLSGTMASNPRVVTRARDEARLLSHLQHPNIVRVEELLSIARRPVIVMEAIEGLSLRELMVRRGKGLPAEAALEAARRTARALEDAYAGTGTEIGHPLKLVHRDIKPGNILLTVYGQVKVVDFELARGAVADRETTTVSTLVGTVGYIAPERFGESAEGPEVDVYSLGVTLIAVLSGAAPTLPMEPGLYTEMLRAAVDRLDPGGLSERSAARVRDLVARMCALDPLDRPTLAELQDEIKTIQHEAGLTTDLSRFAERVVAPLWEARKIVPPHEHKAWIDVAFLETTPPDDLRPADTATPAAPQVLRADEKVREFLSDEGWETRKRELKWLLALEPGWTPEPFLELLDRALDRPWWRVWDRGPSNEQIAVALELLKHRPTRQVAAYAMRFAHHEDDRIAAAANVVVSRAASETSGSSPPRRQ